MASLPEQGFGDGVLEIIEIADADESVDAEHNYSLQIGEFCQMCDLLSEHYWLLTAEIPHEQLFKDKRIYVIGKAINNLLDEAVGALEELEGDELENWIARHVVSLNNLIKIAAALLHGYGKKLPFKSLNQCYFPIIKSDLYENKSELIEWQKETTAVYALRAFIEAGFAMPSEMRCTAEVLFELLDVIDQDFRNLDDFCDALEAEQYDPTYAIFLSEFVEQYAAFFYNGNIEAFLGAQCDACDISDYHAILGALSETYVPVLESDVCEDLMSGLCEFLEFIRGIVVKQLFALRASLDTSSLPVA